MFEYYPWYGTNPWRHWNQWRRVPPLDMATSSVPRLGPYDSADAAVVAQRARWMLEAGVGAINLSWWGTRQLRRSASADRHGRGTPPPARTGFFLTVVNSFNEWHEGTQVEPVRAQRR